MLFFPFFFFFKPSTVQLPSLEEISFVQDFFQICHRRELKVFILRHFTNHSRRGTLSFYHLSLIRKKKCSFHHVFCFEDTTLSSNFQCWTGSLCIIPRHLEGALHWQLISSLCVYYHAAFTWPQLLLFFCCFFLSSGSYPLKRIQPIITAVIFKQSGDLDRMVIYRAAFLFFFWGGETIKCILIFSLWTFISLVRGKHL